MQRSCALRSVLLNRLFRCVRAAAGLMIRYAFEELKLHRLFLRVYADNIRAINSYEKAGFVEEGRFCDDVYINGQFQDVIFMGMINPTERRKD